MEWFSFKNAIKRLTGFIFLIFEENNDTENVEPRGVKPTTKNNILYQKPQKFQKSTEYV